MTNHLDSKIGDSSMTRIANVEVDRKEFYISMPFDFVFEPNKRSLRISRRGDKDDLLNNIKHARRKYDKKRNHSSM